MGAIAGVVWLALRGTRLVPLTQSRRAHLLVPDESPGIALVASMVMPPLCGRPGTMTGEPTSIQGFEQVPARDNR